MNAHTWTECAVNTALENDDLESALVSYAIGTICAHHGATSFELNDGDGGDMSLTVFDTKFQQEAHYTFDEWYVQCVKRLKAQTNGSR
jgi:hypothetical protein